MFDSPYTAYRLGDFTNNFRYMFSPSHTGVKCNTQVFNWVYEYKKGPIKKSTTGHSDKKKKKKKKYFFNNIIFEYYDKATL